MQWKKRVGAISVAVTTVAALYGGASASEEGVSELACAVAKHAATGRSVPYGGGQSAVLHDLMQRCRDAECSVGPTFSTDGLSAAEARAVDLVRGSTARVVAAADRSPRLRRAIAIGLAKGARRCGLETEAEALLVETEAALDRADEDGECKAHCQAGADPEWGKPSAERKTEKEACFEACVDASGVEGFVRRRLATGRSLERGGLTEEEARDLVEAARKELAK